MEKSNIRKLAAVLFLSASLFTGQSVLADAHIGPPATFEVQGKLLDASGDVVADGDYSFSVALGDDNVEAPTVYWPAQDPSTDGLDLSEIGAVSIVDGIYNFTVGPVDPAALTDNEPYLWVFVEGETFGPQEINSVPYAIAALNASSAAMAESVADGSITTDSLADGAITAIKIAPGAIGDVLIDPSSDATLGDTIGAVDLLKQAVKPTVNLDAEYTIATGVAINKADPFSFIAPALYNPIGGGSAAAGATIDVDGLPTGLTYNQATDTLSGTVALANAGDYTLTITATDFLGQTVTATAVLHVIKLHLEGFAAVISDGLNSGDAPDVSTVYAGDDVTFTFEAVEANNPGGLDANEVPVDLSPYPVNLLKGFAHFGVMSSAANGISSYTIDGVRNFSTGLIQANVHDAGTYSAEVLFSFDQVVAIGNAVVDPIDPGFAIGVLQYGGADAGVSESTDAGNDSEEYSIVVTPNAGFNGSENFVWFKSTAGVATPAQIATSDTLILEEVVQGVDGKAYQNGNQALNPLGPVISYFGVAHNGFADIASNSSIFNVNDNINVAVYPQPRTEYGGYPVSFSVIAGTTNPLIGSTISYQWKYTVNLDTDNIGDNQNFVVIPGEMVIDEDNDNTVLDPDAEVHLELTTTLGGSFLAIEKTILDAAPPADLVIFTPIIEVATGEEVLVDDGGAVVPELGVGLGYFGISDVDGFGPPADPTSYNGAVGEDITFQTVFYVPSALTSAADAGAYVNASTGPALNISSINWFIDQDLAVDSDGDGVVDNDKDLSLPPSEISYLFLAAAEVGEDSDRVAVRSSILLENIQFDDNNDASGHYYAEIVTPYGTYTTGKAELILP